MGEVTEAYTSVFRLRFKHAALVLLVGEPSRIYPFSFSG